MNVLKPQYHTLQPSQFFDTQDGKNITQDLQALSKQYNLGYFFGNAPHDFTINR